MLMNPAHHQGIVFSFDYPVSPPDTLEGHVSGLSLMPFCLSGGAYKKNPHNVPKKPIFLRKKPLSYQKTRFVPTPPPFDKNNLIHTKKNTQEMTMFTNTHTHTSYHKKPNLTKKKKPPKTLTKKTPILTKKKPNLTKEPPVLTEKHLFFLTKNPKIPISYQKKTPYLPKKAPAPPNWLDNPATPCTHTLIEQQTQRTEKQEKSPHRSNSSSNCCSMDGGVCPLVDPLCSRHLVHAYSLGCMTRMCYVMTKALCLK